jgi:thioredoxin-like negative regulator of GroEL
VTAAATAVVQDERPRLIFFYDERSGKSRRAEGFLAHVLQRRGNQKTFRILGVEVGQRPDLADRFRIGTTPTFLVVADKRVQARLESPRGAKAIELLLRPWLRTGPANAEGVVANVMPAADGEKRESEDPEAEGSQSPVKSNADRAKEREREMEESGEELPG